MDPLCLLLVLPAALALGILATGTLVRRYPRTSGTGLAFFFGASAVALLAWIPGSSERVVTWAWVPELGLDFGLRLTAFTAWFGVLILSLGACILLYASAYFSGDRRLPGLLAGLLLFTSAMLGIIWSDNLFLLFLFWEATSLISFLLVGFDHQKEEVREKASQALLVTLAGGAALLGGFLLLQQQFGTASLSTMLSLEAPSLDGPLLTAAIILVALGALTKSAQWPFHFWLPNAMAGPTPVSAYLHSATMVKAGVFLLATLAPLLHGHPLWTLLLGSSGILTVATAVLRAAREDDLKSILASTTLAALGFLTLLAGLGTPAALLGFVIFLTAHALYKAPLFLAAGNLEKRFGSRNLSELRGAIRQSPVTGAALLVSILSLVGFAPLPGFLGKEYLLKATWAHSPALAIAVGLAAAGVLALGLRLLPPLLARSQAARPVAGIPLLMALATLLPALGAVLLTVSLPLTNHRFLWPAASALGAPPEASYKLWHGWTPALGIGLGALAVSLLLAWLMAHPRLRPLPAVFAPLFDGLFKHWVEALRRLAKATGGGLEDGSLRRHLAILLGFVGGLAFLTLQPHRWPELKLSFEPHSMVLVAVVPVLAIAVLSAVRARKTLEILVSLGFVGLLVALFFLWFSAPDLALTQLLAETLLLFLLAAALAKINRTPEASRPFPGRLLVAGLGGFLVGALILKAMILEWDHPISQGHLARSVPEAFGANVVNVILVDFRALDTLGEILVLGIAALGATAALGAARPRFVLPGSSASPWLQTGARLLGAILAPVALWIFWRGHNAPGGGFIAALVAGSGVGFGLLTGLPRFRPTVLRRAAHRLVLGGLAIALIAALLPLLGARPLFTGLWWHAGSLHLGTPLLFDLGVALSVLGFTLASLRHFYPHPKTA